MKTQYLQLFLPIITLFLFVSGTINAQEYIPLVYDGAHWIVRLDKTETPQPVDGLWEYYANGDTTLESTYYTKVFKRSLVITQDGPPFEALEPYQLFGFLRDDSINRKVFAVQNMSFSECPVNSEFLLYDFSLNVGDTATFCLLQTYMDNIIASIEPDSHFGFETNVFSTDFDFRYQYYEGIGSYFGLFEAMFLPVDPAKKNRLGTNYLYFYCRESPCSLLVNDKELSDISLFRVGPNPTTGELNISLPEPNNGYTITLHNIHGILISHYNIKKNTNRLSLELHSYNPGIYFLTIIQKNKAMFRKKILLTNFSY